MNFTILAAKSSFLEVGQAFFQIEDIQIVFFRPRLLTSQISMNFPILSAKSSFLRRLGRRIFSNRRYSNCFCASLAPDLPDFREFRNFGCKFCFFGGWAQAHFFKQKIFKLFCHPRLLTSQIFYEFPNFVCMCFRSRLLTSQISMNFTILTAKSSFLEVGQAHFFK